MVVILLLLLLLAAVAGHNDCQRAGGLELMLELSDWNAQTGHGAYKRAGGLELILELQDLISHECNDQHKGITKINRH